RRMSRPPPARRAPAPRRFSRRSQSVGEALVRHDKPKPHSWHVSAIVAPALHSAGFESLGRLPIIGTRRREDCPGGATYREGFHHETTDSRRRHGRGGTDWI